jgi:hypothetical protein
MGLKRLRFSPPGGGSVGQAEGAGRRGGESRAPPPPSGAPLGCGWSPSPCGGGE